MISSFTCHYQDLVLISIFDIQMCIMFIIKQDYIKVKQIPNCSLKCELPYYAVSVLKEYTGD